MTSKLFKRVGSTTTSYQTTNISIYAAIFQDPISDFLVVDLRPYVKANCPYFFENDSTEVCSVSQLEGPEAGAPLDLFPGDLDWIGLDYCCCGWLVVWLFVGLSPFPVIVTTRIMNHF